MEERQGRFRIGLEQIGDFIRLLESAYRKSQDENVFSVLQGLREIEAQIRADIWVQEDAWRKQEMIEAFIYFDQLPHSVQVFLLNDKLNS
jgi:hypothetical protein